MNPSPTADIDALVEHAARLPAPQRRRLRAGAADLRARFAPLAPHAESLLERLIDGLDRDEREEALETRLIDKLAAAGQLRPGYLLRALDQKRLSLFIKALARLGDYDVADVRRAVSSPDQPELLALACAGIGIDRSAFPAILARVRNINAGLPGGGEEAARRAMGAFAPFSASVAAEAFRRAAGLAKPPAV